VFVCSSSEPSPPRLQIHAQDHRMSTKRGSARPDKIRQSAPEGSRWGYEDEPPLPTNYGSKRNHFFPHPFPKVVRGQNRVEGVSADSE
jgi:hypothetical protein